MNLPYPNVCKLLLLIAIGIIGHQVEPLLLTDKVEQQEVVKTVPKSKPEPEIKPEPIAEIPAPDLSKKIKPQEIATKIKIPEPPKIEPVKPEVKPEKVSPLETAILTLVGNEADSSNELKKDAEYLEYASYNGEWANYRAMLNRSLTEAYSQTESKLSKNNARYEYLWREPRFYSALLRWKMLGLFPTKVTDQTKSRSGAAEMMKWLLTHDQALEEVILTLHKKDKPDLVFEFLSKVWTNKPFVYQEKPLNKGDANDLEKIIPKYFNLALACAVVFDEQIDYKNPNTDGSNIDGMLRYHWYRSKNEGGLLEGDIHNASAKDLTFVVCSPVSTEELEWALSEYRSKRRKSMGQPFSDIKYLMERAVEGLDPYEEYTLPEILKEGGICGDQTYFCVNTARAAGIPAFGLSGLTDSGGHAWACVKLDKDEWSTETGRIAGVSEGKGDDLQTGESISEQAVWHWSEPKVASRTNTIEVFRHLWLADYFTESYHTQEVSPAINVAHSTGQMFPLTWQYAYQQMLSQGELIATPELPATLTIWKDFVKNLKHEFRKNPRIGSLAAVIEDKHIFPHSDIDDVRRDLARLRRRDSKNAAEQADLMTSSLKREAELILKSTSYDPDKALEEIHQLYTRSFRDYGNSLTGFRDIMFHYFSLMKDDKERAEDSVQAIERAFDRMIDKGSEDWFRKQEEISIYREIAKMYHEIGETKRAASIEKRLARDEKNSGRKAL